jgi:hypothetical protein
MDRFVEIIERGKQAGDPATRSHRGRHRTHHVVERRIIESGGIEMPDTWPRHPGFVLDGLRPPGALSGSPTSTASRPGAEVNQDWQQLR